MAPPRTANDSSSDAYHRERQEFLTQLQAFHLKRGTTFDPDPRVGSKHIDLLQLYRTVVERGGYDRVSDEKLLWRKLGTEFNLGANNLPALAFALKSTYYKQLAAYEIVHIHGKEPPPKEILEETTAKGAGLLTRTLENFRPSVRKETAVLGPEHSEASGDDGTPAHDRIGSEETLGSGGRVTRGLRQAPPQRILFQPDTQPVRQSRHPTSHPPHAHQPQHHGHRGASTSHNPSSSMENTSSAITNFEPRAPMPLTLRPVITPGNNPIEFARRQQVLKLAAAVESGQLPAVPPPRLVLPGSEFTIYSIQKVATNTSQVGLMAQISMFAA
jgi:chromatin structure-remodeling complex subunit RSC9